MTTKPDSHSAFNGLESTGRTGLQSQPTLTDNDDWSIAMAEQALTPPAGDRQHVPTDQAAPELCAGTISTDRHPVVRYRAGWDCGDTFGTNSDYDGLALTIEIADAGDAQAMLAAISRRAEIQPDPEPKPVAWRWKKKGASTVGWDFLQCVDFPIDGPLRDKLDVEPLYAIPSSAGTVSVEAAVAKAATEYLRWIEYDFPSGIGPEEMEAREKLRAALRALAGEGGR